MSGNNADSKAAKSATGYFSFKHKVIAVALSVVMLGFGCPVSSHAENAEKVTESAAAQTKTVTAEDDSSVGSTDNNNGSSVSGEAITKEASSSSGSEKSEASDELNSSSQQTSGTPSNANSTQANAAVSDASNVELQDEQAVQADIKLNLGNAYIMYNEQVIASPSIKTTVPTTKDFTFSVKADNGYKLNKVVLTVNGKESTLAANLDNVYTVGVSDILAGASLTLVTEENQTTNEADAFAATSTKAITSIDDPDTAVAIANEQIMIEGPSEVEQFKSIALTVAVDTDVTWTSSDENIATVDAAGKVTGIKEGVVTIMATTVTAEGKVLTATHDVAVAASTAGTKDAYLFFQNSPTANPDTNSTAAWFPSGGSHSLGIKLNLEGATFTGSNSYDNVANRVVSWPDGSTGASWALDKNSSTYSTYWYSIFNAWQSTLEQEQGTTITEDDIESIVLKPYKISNNSCGYHLDCKVEVKCSKVINAVFYLQDVGSTGFAQYDAATYKLDKGKASVAAPAKTPEDIKTHENVAYKFMGWYTDAACTQAVSFPTTARANVSYYAKYVPMDQTVTVNYYLKGTTTPVAASNTLTGLIKGQKVTQSPKAIDGYTAVSNDPVTVTVGEQQEINFYYTANDVSYTVEYCWNGTKEQVVRSELGTAKVGEVIEKLPQAIDGYTAVSDNSQEIKLSADATKNVITFYYYKNVTLTAHSKTVSYNGLEQTLEGYDSSVPGLVFGDVVCPSVTGINAGEYPLEFAEGVVGKTDTTDRYVVSAVEPGKLIINTLSAEKNITIEPNNVSYVYDSDAHPAGSATASAVDNEGNALTADIHIQYRVKGSPDDEWRDNPSEITWTNAYDAPVAIELRAWAINFDGYAYSEEALTITKRPVKLTTKSATKVYDGTALTTKNDWDGYEVLPKANGGFIFTELAVGSDGYPIIGCTGAITSVGSIPNTIEYKLKEGYERNYDIQDFQLGTLTVTAQSINPGSDPENPNPSYKGVTVSISNDEVYNAHEHKWVPEVKDGNGSALVEGADYTVTYQRDGKVTNDFTNAGTITVTVTGIGNYTDSVERTYQITPQLYTVVTDSATKDFNGTALTAFGKIEGLVNSSDATFTVTGSQTEVGSSVNTYQLSFVNDQMANNYQLADEKLGTLTVTSAITPTPDSDPDPEPPVPDPDPDPTPDPSPNPEPEPAPESGTNPSMPSSSQSAASTPVAADDADSSAAADVIRSIVDTNTAITNEAAVADEEVATVSEEKIEDEQNPLGNTQVHTCWTHVYMGIGLLLTLLYGVLVALRRSGHTRKLKNDMNDIMGGGDDDKKQSVATTTLAGTEA